MKNLQDILPSDVSSVYSGKAGKCCCGCSGNHYYSSLHRLDASKDRGYEVGDDEVNDSMVTKVLRTVQANEEVLDTNNHEGIFSVHVGKRLYVVYLHEKILESIKVVAEWRAKKALEAIVTL